MKKSFLIIIITSLAFGCSERKSSDFQNIDSENINALRSVKEAYNKELVALNDELEKINAAISKLDPNERLPLITVYKMRVESFYHFIEVQGNIKSRKNILLFP